MSADLAEIERRLRALEKRLERAGSRTANGAVQAADRMGDAIASALSDMSDRFRGRKPLGRRRCAQARQRRSGETGQRRLATPRRLGGAPPAHDAGDRRGRGGHRRPGRPTVTDEPPKKRRGGMTTRLPPFPSSSDQQRPCTALGAALEEQRLAGDGRDRGRLERLGDQEGRLGRSPVRKRSG